MPSAYKWRPLPAGALGHSVNPETISRNEHRASLTPLETTFARARANQGNRLKQRRDFARRYDEYQALDDETTAQVDQEMIVEENEVLEQERVAILADWRQYYPNQFCDDGLPPVNPSTPIEVDSPPNSPASSVFPSPKMRPAAQMKSLLDRLVKRPRSSSTGSALVPPAVPSVSQDAPPGAPASKRFGSTVIHSRSVRPRYPLQGPLLDPLWLWRGPLHFIQGAQGSLSHIAPGLG